MFEKLLATTIALSMLGGCASTSEPKYDEVIPYDDSKSLAYNVAKQGDFHYKLNDVDVPEDATVRSKGVMGHMVSTFLFSPNFAGSLGLSLTSDDDHGANQPQLVLSTKIPNNVEDMDAFILEYVRSKVLAHDPTTEFFDISSNYGFIYYSHRGDICTKSSIDSLEIFGENKYERDILKSNKCDMELKYSLIGPSNQIIFPNSVGETTIRLHFGGQLLPGTYLQAFDNAYLYNKSVYYNDLNVTIPMHVQHKEFMYVFVNPDQKLQPTNVYKSVIKKHKEIGLIRSKQQD